MKTVICKNCGASVEVDEKEEFVTCEYCTTTFKNKLFKKEKTPEKEIYDDTQDMTNIIKSENVIIVEHRDENLFCPNCNSTDIKKHKYTYRKGGSRGCLFWVLIVLFFPWSLLLFLIPNMSGILVEKTKYKCKKCGKVWTFTK